ncbi:thioredoxin domain-containing protein [uncultured Novosphingobium sp.]|uniref:DsbA family protein n=1 Tax=uncultured Novosphingobium sp. TaxID=292277 RepID=UPI0025903472|nr:thioredoxin domain-containing protein [uncultured Novosphingobium sp.]
MIHRSIRLTALFAAATLGISASPPHPNWNATVGIAAQGAYTLGNPAAKVKLTEYVSYTCPHCGHFHKEADPRLRLTYVPQGKVSVTVQQVLRNPVDLTIAMLTNCGDPKGFFPRHNAFMGAQDQWLSKLETFTSAQTSRWSNGEVPTRLRAIASDLDFYAIMARFGRSRPQVDVCLADGAVMKRVTSQTEAASAAGVQGTPSFAINGELQDAHDWASLAPLIDAKL